MESAVCTRRRARLFGNDFQPDPRHFNEMVVIESSNTYHGARTLLGAPGIATRSILTRNKKHSSRSFMGQTWSGQSIRTEVVLRSRTLSKFRIRRIRPFRPSKRRRCHGHARGSKQRRNGSIEQMAQYLLGDPLQAAEDRPYRRGIGLNKKHDH